MMRITKGILFGLFLTAVFGAAAQAAVYPASSCSTSNVQAAINAASNGDTVTIPNGSCTWTSGISTTKQIQIQAQNYTPTAGGTNARNVTLTHNAGSNALFALATGNTASVGVAGIKFLAGSGTGSYIDVSGSGSKVALINDNYFEIATAYWPQAPFIQWSARGGVLWNNLWEATGTDGGSPGSGGTSFHVTSPIAWLSASTWGVQDTNGDQNLYIEDSTFHEIFNQAVDCDDNCRIVIRYNTIRNTQMLHHGTTSLQGGRQSEFYNNAFQSRQVGGQDVNLNRYVWLRAGSMRVADNTIEPIVIPNWGGGKPEFVFIAESLTRSGAGSGCQTEANYPGTHWPGQGANGSSQVTDPIRFWNNTEVGGAWNWGTNDQSGSEQNCSGGTSADVIVLNRDVILSAPSGYTKYTYPHPLRQGTVATTPTAPTGLQIKP